MVYKSLFYPSVFICVHLWQIYYNLECNLNATFHLILVQFHAQPWQGGEGHHAVDRLEWSFEEMLVDRVPLDQIFEQRTSGLRPGGDDVG